VGEEVGDFERILRIGLRREEVACCLAANPFGDDIADVGRAFDKALTRVAIPTTFIATGIVARPPTWLTQTGSRWVLLIDADGVRHESDLA
jgi:hypothetical protein